MAVKKFFLCGEPTDSAEDIDLSNANDLDGVKAIIASRYAIVQPEGMSTWVSESISHEILIVS